MQTYVAEIDGRAVIAFRASSAAEAQIWLENNKAVRADLAAPENGGRPLWDGKAEIVARAATFEEMAAWRRKSVELPPPPGEVPTVPWSDAEVAAVRGQRSGNKVVRLRASCRSATSCGPASRQAGTTWQKSQQWPTHRNYSGSGSSQYVPSVKSQFGTKSSSRLFLAQGKLMGGRARKHLRENSHVQDRTHSSGEDALTVRGVGSRRTCNPVLDSDLADAGQRPNCTGSGADNGSLCLYD
jgi:hypothetical protein